MGKPIIHDKGSGELSPLNFELVGIFNVKKMLSNDKVDTVLNFYKNGHPSKNIQYTPALIKRVFENEDKIIAIFFATKMINPDSSRKLFTIDQIEDYRQRFDLEFKEEWNSMSFEEIKNKYEN